jgi:hypothetical protein
MLFQAMRKYGREIERFNDTGSADFYDLIAAFVYCPIIIRKVIHILLAQWKSSLELWDNESIERLNNNNDTGLATLNDSSLNSQDTSYSRIINASSPPSPRTAHKCHALKCRLLQAKGIIQCPMACARGQNCCSGCSNESAKQRRVIKLENEILTLSVENNILAPILEFRTKPTVIKHFRNVLSCIPSIASFSRDDHIFGVVRYLASALGILIQEHSSSNILDPSMTDTESKQTWRIATFFCRCQEANTITYNVRTFCTSCSYLLPLLSLAQMTACPGCNLFDLWAHSGHPCLACQLANITFQNPIGKLFESLVNMWLPMAEDFESRSEDDESYIKLPSKELKQAYSNDQTSQE